MENTMLEQLKEYTSNGELLEIKRMLEEHKLSPDINVLDQYRYKI